MTCIVAVVKEKRIWMGCDSLAMNEDDTRTLMRDPKMVKSGELLMGTAGSLRLQNVLHHVFIPPQRRARMTDLKYLCGPFVDALQKSFRDHAPRIEEQSKDGIDMAMLIGYRGNLYYLDGEFDICRTMDDFEACGSGEDVARGALFATPKLAPRTRVLKALTAAERYKGSVARPFKVFEN